MEMKTEKRLKQTREIKEKKLEDLKERIETNIGCIVLDVWEGIELIVEREAEIIKELEKLKKQKNRKRNRNKKGRIILAINKTKIR